MRDVVTRGRDVYAPPALLIGLLAVVVWLPVPLGSNRPWAWSLMHAAAMTGLGLWCLGYAWRARRLAKEIGRQRTALILFGCWISYVALQTLPLPAAFVELFSPMSYAHQNHASLLGLLPEYAISVDRGASLFELQKLSAYVAMFFLTVSLVNSRKRLRLALLVVVMLGTLEAFYGILVYLSGSQSILWHPGFNRDAVSGTYVNRNHFAGLMEITIPATLGLMLAEAPISYGANWRGVLRGVLDNLLRRTGWLSCCLLIMIAALLLSTSRGGLAALIFGVGFTLACAAIGQRRDAAAARLVPRLVVFALIGIAWLGAGGLIQKIEAVGVSSNRGDIREATIRMMSDFWLTGSGAGTFPWVFPAYKNESLAGGFYTHAHNDFLQLLAEQGVIGFAFAGAAIGILLWQVFSAYRRRRDPLMRGVLFASGSGSIALLAHGTVDFNLNIPANAALFFVMLGLGSVASHLNKGAGFYMRPDSRGR